MGIQKAVMLLLPVRLHHQTLPQDIPSVLEGI